MGIGQAAASAAEQKKATEEQKKKSSIIEEQDAEENALYNKKRYSDISKRAEFRNLFRMYAQNQRNADARSEAQAAITGATGEQKESARETNRRTFADAMANAVANANQLIDQYDATHQGRRDRYYAQRLGMQDQLAGIHANAANQWSTGANSAFKAGAGLLAYGLGNHVPTSNATPTGFASMSVTPSAAPAATKLVPAADSGTVGNSGTLYDPNLLMA